MARVTGIGRVAVAAALACALPAVVAAQTAGFRGGPDHAGVYPAPAAAASGMVRWSYETDGPVRSSPAVDGDAVLVGSGDGRLHAVDRRSGEALWSYDAGAPVHSSPAVAGGAVFITDLRNRVHAVDRATGRGLWTVETGPDMPWAWGWENWDYFTSSPTVVDGRVHVGSGDGSVYALDAATGRVLWTHPTGGRVRSSPAVVDGTVYVGSADGVLHALDAVSGEPRWRFETEGASRSSAEFGFDRVTIQASPAVRGGVVYFGSRDGRSYALDAASGELRWMTPDATAWFVTSPAVDDGVLYDGSSDGLYVHALDTRTGEELWRTRVGQRVFSSPALAGDAVFVGNHAGRFLRLRASDGTVEWELRFGEVIMSSPAVAGDAVYFGADDGVLRAIELAPAPPPERAVYWDSTRVERTTFADHEVARDLFRRRGYRVVDADGLAAFLADEAESGRASVVVFAMDDLPPGVASGADDAGPLLRYLDSGGKVVWLGLPPFFIDRDQSGAPTGVDRAAPTELLGIDFDAFDVDRHAARPTPLGERWGLGGWWIGGSGVDDPSVGALALDERGRASAWVRSFGGPPGTGFILAWDTFRPLEPGFLDALVEVAEYGIGRVPR